MSHSFGGRRGSGPQLPYELVAGVMPTRAGWVVASAKLIGVQLHPQDAELFTNLVDIIDYRPAFRIIALGTPIGLPDKPGQKGRTCDHEARALLGWPRAGAVLSPPVRDALTAKTYEQAAKLSGGLSAVTWGLMHRIAETDREIETYRQRAVVEVHPELSLYQLNEDKPMKNPKRTVVGQEERAKLIQSKIAGMELIIDAKIPKVNRWQLIDAAACLTTTRRIVSRSMTRIPTDPEWDEKGLRMEIVR